VKWAWQRQGGMRNVSGSSGFGFSTRLLAEFDPDTVRPLPLEVVHDFPTGAKHIKEAAEGIIATVVDGEVVMEGHRHLTARRVLSNTYYHANHG